MINPEDYRSIDDELTPEQTGTREVMREHVWKNIRSLPPEFLRLHADEMEKRLESDETNLLAEYTEDEYPEITSAYDFSNQLPRKYLDSIPLSDRGRILQAQIAAAILPLQNCPYPNKQNQESLISYVDELLTIQKDIDRLSTIMQEGNFAFAYTILNRVDLEVRHIQDVLEDALNSTEQDSLFYTSVEKVITNLSRVRGDGSTLWEKLHAQIAELKDQLNDGLYQLQRKER